VFKAQTQLSILGNPFGAAGTEQRSRVAEIDSILNRAAGTPVGRRKM